MTFLVLVALGFCLTVSASANLWGLRGALYQAFSAEKTWDDYLTVADQKGNFAILGDRYHNALFYAEKDSSLCVWHTAVWQPKDQVKQRLHLTDNGIVL